MEKCIISHVAIKKQDIIINVKYNESLHLHSDQLCPYCNEFLACFTPSFRSLAPNACIRPVGENINIGHLLSVFDSIHAMYYDKSLFVLGYSPLQRLFYPTSPDYNVEFYNEVRNLIVSPVTENDSTDGACDKVKIILETLLKVLQSKAITKLLAVISKKNDD